MKTLVVYYSFTGNNKALVERLREGVECDVLAIEEERGRNGFSILLDLVFRRKARLKKYNVNLREYQHIIAVAPVWAGKPATPMQTFLLRERRNLHDYAFFTVCGGVAGQKEKLAESLFTMTGTRPEVVEEIWIKDFLPVEKREDVRFSSNYRITGNDLKTVDHKVEGFLRQLRIPVRARNQAQEVHIV